MKSHKCIKCEKKVKIANHFKPRCEHEKETFIANEGNTWIMVANYGSKFDNDIIKLTICDECLENYLKNS